MEKVTDIHPFMDKDSEMEYPSWAYAKPNLQTFLVALNQSEPISQNLFEIVWSRWPRTIFFSKNAKIPGLTVQNQELNHAGFTVSIPTHVKYESTEITLTILADKEGFHYYDLRNMVLATAHPLVAGDTRSTIGNPYGLSPDEDTLEIRLRNKPDDMPHHHWILHNFRPTGIGEIELSHDSASFVTFDLTGTFTHITYDCGEQLTPEPAAPSPLSPPVATPNPPTIEGSMIDSPEPDEQDEMDYRNMPDYEEYPTGASDFPDEDEQQQDGYEDLRPNQEEEPTPPEPSESQTTPPEPEPVNENVDVMSGSRTSISNDNCKIFVNTTSDVKFDRGEGGTPVTEEEIAAAKECNQEMTKASDELKAEMEKIAQMPPDPNFNPKDGKVSDKKLASTKTPTQEQTDASSDESGRKKGDKVVSLVQTDCQFKSQAQVDAYNTAMEKYNNRVKQAQTKYKESKPDPTKQQANDDIDDDW